jgi:hypothetical protein
LGYEPEAADVEQLVRLGEVKQSLPVGASHVDSGTISIERRRGYWVRMEMSEERAGFRMDQNVIIYLFFFRGSAIALTSPFRRRAVTAMRQRTRYTTTRLSFIGHLLK